MELSSIPWIYSWKPARSGLTPATQRVDQRFRGVPLGRGARFIFGGEVWIDGTGGVTSIHMSHVTGTCSTTGFHLLFHMVLSSIADE